MPSPRPLLLLLVVLVCPKLCLAFVPVHEHGAQVELRESRWVVAAEAQRTTLWGQLVLRHTGERLVVLVPIGDTAKLDAADADWFAALEQATAPRILPPVDTHVSCGAVSGVESTVAIARAESIEPSMVSVLSSRASWQEFLDQEQLELDPEVLSAVPPEVQALVALEYPVLPEVPMALALRLQEELSAPEVLTRLSPLVAWRQHRTTLTSIAEQPQLVSAKSWLSSSEVKATWFAERGVSDYVDKRNALLDRHHGSLWISEVVGQTHLFDAYFPDGEAEVPSLVGALQARLAERGYECPDWISTVSQARASGARAQTRCAPGTLARSEAAECPPANASDVDLTCDGSHDLALALSGAVVKDSVLTRQVGVLVAAPILEARSSSLTALQTLKVYAHEVESQVCEASTSTTGAVTFGGSIPSGGGMTQAPPLDPPPTQERPPPDVVVVTSYEACSCGSGPGTSSSNDDDCGGDSSSSSDDTCSGDSSSDTGSDETCSGDSSSDSPAGDSCSGDGAEAEGETCTGSGSSGAESGCSSGGGGSECALRKGRFPRPRLSVLTLTACLVLLPWRRRQRRPRRKPLPAANPNSSEIESSRGGL